MNNVTRLIGCSSELDFVRQFQVYGARTCFSVDITSLNVERNVQCDEVNDVVSDDNDYECLCDVADDDDLR